ncbi:MAG: helix-turn-helix transcriptional regulator [Deltaproteobacteria bacterium]|nr:helix-turn-helix transcriptional regulator [Deltaproteobacteria bacterium]
MDIRELREMSGKTQVEVAQAMEIAHSELSRLERRDDHLVSTLRKYVKALDGELEIVARFGNKSIKLHSL